MTTDELRSGDVRAGDEVRAGSLTELRRAGHLLTKVGTLPVVVFWDDGTAFAIEDRCPHLGFPLHQGTVEAGLVTCHWHHARFDLVSGCTLDLWADDARGFDVDIRGDDVFVHPRVHADPVGHLQAPAAQRPRGRHLARDREVGARPARRRRARRRRSCAPASSSARATAIGLGRGPHGARRDGEPAPPARPRRPRARARARLDVRRARHEQPGAALRRSARSRRRRCRSTGSASGTGASSTPARPTRPSARSRPRSPSPADSADGRDDDVRRGHRPRVHRRRPHASTSRTRRSRRSSTSARTPPPRSCRRSCARPPPRHAREEFGEWRHPHDHAAIARRTIDALDDGAATPADPPRHVRRRRRARLAAARRRPRSRRDRAARRAARRRDRGADRPRDRVRGRAAHRSLPRAERPRRLGHRAPRVHGRQRAAPERCSGSRRPSSCAARCTPRCASTSIASSTCPRPVSPHATTGDARRARRAASTCRAWSTTPATRPTASCAAAAPAPSSSPRSGTRCSPRTPSSTGTRCSRPRCARRSSGPRDREEAALVLTAVARFLAAHTPTRRELPTVVRIATRLRRGEALYEDEDAQRPAFARRFSWSTLAKPSSSSADVDVVGGEDRGRRRAGGGARASRASS